MENKRSFFMRYQMITRFVIVIFTGIISAIAVNDFLVPGDVFAAGVTGVAQLLEGLFSFLHIPMKTGILIFLINIPIMILGWVKLGKQNTIYSILTVFSVSFFTTIIPQTTITDNQLMNSLMGGVLLGMAVGLCLKFGFTTGGLDIVSLVLSKTTGKTVGSFMMLINMLIVIFAGIFYNLASALYTIICIFAMTQVIDLIHTSHQKLTAFITTSKAEEVKQSILKDLVRGFTLMPSVGGYSGQDTMTIMIVISRYELYDLEQAVYTVDENAFVNIVPTQTVLGRFYNEDEQKAIKRK
ncbi:YitT family protein [Catellicoccus marimammalium]|nr:YitT family protein [Catellicoccus marimammalium]